MEHSQSHTALRKPLKTPQYIQFLGHYLMQTVRIVFDIQLICYLTQHGCLSSDVR